MAHRIIPLAAAFIGAVALGACASQPHSASNMLEGSHVMPGNKGGVMADRNMPAMSANCQKYALAKMPADHREACRAAAALNR